MKKINITRAALGRLPKYLRYVQSHLTDDTISAASIARGLGLGEVQVRKDLGVIGADGRPKVGYQTRTLFQSLNDVLCPEKKEPAVLVGAGKLGLALLGYEGFGDYGLEITAAFDCDAERIRRATGEARIYPSEAFPSYCQRHAVHTGVITVPADSAQSVCDTMVACGITAIWNFAHCELHVPDHITVKQEDLALSLAHLYVSANSQATCSTDRKEGLQ